MSTLDGCCNRGYLTTVIRSLGVTLLCFAQACMRSKLPFTSGVLLSWHSLLSETPGNEDNGHVGEELAVGGAIGA